MGHDTDKFDDKEEVMTEGPTSITASHQLHRGGTLERQQSRKNVGMIRGASNLDMKGLNYQTQAQARPPLKTAASRRGNNSTNRKHKVCTAILAAICHKIRMLGTQRREIRRTTNPT
jgi:hypothetical protein